MDAEHRHELHSNEMVKFIQNFPEIVKKNLTTVLGIILILGAIVTYGPVQGYFKAKKLVACAEVTADLTRLGQSKKVAVNNLQADTDAVDTSLLVTANALQAAVGKSDADSLKAFAYIKRAESLRAGLHYTSEDPESVLITGEIEKAKKAYNQALVLAGGNVNLAAKAQLGLGLCEEELGNYDAAEEIYNKLIDNADYSVTVFPRQAKSRIENFAEYKIDYVFVEAPVAVTETIQPGVFSTTEVIAPEAAAKDGDSEGEIVIIDPESAGN